MVRHDIVRVYGFKSLRIVPGLTCVWSSRTFGQFPKLWYTNNYIKCLIMGATPYSTTDATLTCDGTGG
jgi:hypothetical protein